MNPPEQRVEERHGVQWLKWIVLIVLVGVLAWFLVPALGDLAKLRSGTPASALNAPTAAPYSAPYSIGATAGVVFEDGSEMSVTVNSVESGRTALADLHKANEFNPTPGANEQYLIAKVTVSYTKGSKPFTLNQNYFRALSEGELMSVKFLSLPDQFDSVTLMPGATATHSVVLLAKYDDNSPLMGFGVANDGTGGVYFKLT